jgi:hypothetical protein
MSRILEILKRAELFLKISQDENFAGKSKKQIAMLERAKENPDDPEYLEYLQKKRDAYNLNQEMMGTDPKALELWQAGLRDRQKKFKEKVNTDPALLEKYKARMQEQHAKKMRQLVDSSTTDPLDLKLFLFGRQIANKKSEDNKKKDKLSPVVYEKNRKQLQELLLFVIVARDLRRVIHNQTIAGIKVIDSGRNVLREISTNPSMTLLANTLIEIIDILNKKYNS